MTEQDQTCVLRTLNLCDGQAVREFRSAEACFCGELAIARAHGAGSRSSELLHARARMVARAGDVERTQALRQKLDDLRERANRF